MMYALLKALRKMPLTQATVEAFLYRAAMLTVIREISLDDWIYLAHLVAYRTTTRCNASDKEKAVMAKIMHDIVADKKRLDNSLN